MKKIISILIISMPFWAFAAETRYLTVDDQTVAITTNGTHTTITPSSQEEAIEAQTRQAIVDFAKEHPVAAGIAALVAGTLYLLASPSN